MSKDELVEMVARKLRDITMDRVLREHGPGAPIPWEFWADDARAIIPIVLEAAGRVAEAEAQRCREAVASCPEWSAAQGEWSRARDACLNIIDRLQSLSKAQEGG